MANRPCNQAIICPGSDNPLGNFSSEAPDPFSYFSFRYPIVNPHNPIGGDGPRIPPTYFANDCAGICVSTISQEDADLCAARQAYICSHTPPGGQPPQLFFNTLQTCSVACGNGSFFVWQVPPGSFVALSQAAADEQAQAYACLQAARHAFCLNDIDPDAQVGIAYFSTIFVQSGFPRQPVRFSIIAGSLPPGLALVPEGPLSSVITGTPTATGVYTFTVLAVDALNIIVTKVYTITVLQITPAHLPDGTVGTAYSQQLTLAGGFGAVTFTRTGGSLPDGLNLSSSGLISGTPTTAQTANFEITAVDANSATCIQQFSLTVALGCDASTDWINNPGTCRLRIKTYVDGTFINNMGCPAYDAGAGVVWDGTFRNFVPIVPNTACRYDIVGQGFGQISGFAIASASVQFFLTFSAGHWVLQVSALSGGVPQTLWTSNNKVGTNPLGTYTFFNGCSSVPASLIVEGF
jgi:hypothetical protein